MGNMSYCRFRNTVTDLQDCYDNMDELEDDDTEESESRSRLIKLCKNIADEYSEED